MKKIFLSIAVVASSYGLAMATGSCAIGSATLSNGSQPGTVNVGCPGNGTCYETDRSDPRFLQPGDIIYIHLGGQLIRAVVKKAAVNTSPGQTPPGGDPGKQYYHIDSGNITVIIPDSEQ